MAATPERSFTRESLEMVAERFKVLGEPTRLRILDALREGEKTVSALVEELGTSQANVSKHLGILRRHRMVSRRKEGVRSHYAISDPLIFQLCDLVCDRLETEFRTQREALSRDDEG